jgi:hypothetical protein
VLLRSIGSGLKVFSGWCVPGLCFGQSSWKKRLGSHDVVGRGDSRVGGRPGAVVL